MDIIRDLRVDFITLVANNKFNNSKITSKMHLKNSINNTHNNKIELVRCNNKTLPKISSSLTKIREIANQPNNNIGNLHLNNIQTNRTSNNSNTALSRLLSKHT